MHKEYNQESKDVSKMCTVSFPLPPSFDLDLLLNEINHPVALRSFFSSLAKRCIKLIFVHLAHTSPHLTGAVLLPSSIKDCQLGLSRHESIGSGH